MLLFDFRIALNLPINIRLIIIIEPGRESQRNYSKVRGYTTFPDLNRSIIENNK